MATKFLGRVAAAPSTPGAGIDLIYQLSDGHIYLKNSIGTFDLTSGGVTVHNDLSSIQGGSASEKYHLTSAQHILATQLASGSLTGLLSSTDWSTFNGKSSYADPLTTNGDIVIRASGSTTRLAIGSTGQVLTVAAGLPSWAAAASGGKPTGDINGLQTSWSSNSQLIIGVGSCRSDDDTTDLVVSSPLTCALSSSGANGLDTGAEANSTGYYLWLIWGSSPGYASLFSLSDSAPTMPANYTKKRLVGWGRNNSSGNLIKYYQFGGGRARTIQYDAVRSTTLRVLSGGTATSFTEVDCSSLCPSNTCSIFLVSQLPSTTGGYGYVRVTGSTVASGGLGITGYSQISWAEIITSTRSYEYAVTSGSSLTNDMVGYRVVI